MNHLDEIQEDPPRVPRYVDRPPDFEGVKLLYPADPIKLIYVGCIINKILTLGNGEIKSAYDFGCGTGMYIQVLLDRGVSTLGFEGSLGVKKEIKTDEKNIVFANLEYPISLEYLPRDLVLSIEFAEHLSKAGGELLYDTMTKLSKKWIVMTASPGEGECHLNPQPRQYWIDKIVKRKTHTYYEKESEEFMDYFKSAILQKDGLIWFKRDLMIFRKI